MGAGVQSTDCSTLPARRMTKLTSVLSGTPSVMAYRPRSSSQALAAALIHKACIAFNSLPVILVACNCTRLIAFFCSCWPTMV